MSDPNNDLIFDPKFIKYKINKETWQHLQMNEDRILQNFGRVTMKSKGYIERDDQFLHASLSQQDNNYYLLISLTE